MRGTIAPLPHTPSMRGAQLQEEHRDNFTFAFYDPESEGMAS